MLHIIYQMKNLRQIIVSAIVYVQKHQLTRNPIRIQLESWYKMRFMDDRNLAESTTGKTDITSSLDVQTFNPTTT